MQINILIPHREIFSKNNIASVSQTVINNLKYTNFKNDIKIYGRFTKDPMYKKNFVGIKDPINFFKSKNKNLASQMCKYISNSNIDNHIIEIHNRPYLVHLIKNTLKKKKYLTLFLHNDPLNMKGLKTVSQRIDVLSKLDRVYCVSEYVKKRFLQNIKIKENNKVAVLYNGVERYDKKFPSKKKKIIFVGRIVKEKGIHLFVEAVSRLSKIYQDWEFLIIGSPKLGSNKFNDNFSKSIVNNFLEISNNTTVKGYINFKKVREIMSKSSIIVIPSLWQEPFGLVAAEAMSCGTAIISSNHGGLPEIIKKNGILIKNINELKLTLAIEKLIKNPILLKKYQQLAWNNFEHTASLSSTKLDLFRQEILLEKSK